MNFLDGGVPCVVFNKFRIPINTIGKSSKNIQPIIKEDTIPPNKFLYNEINYVLEKHSTILDCIKAVVKFFFLLIEGKTMIAGILF
jgi:hypothetical protein